MKGTLRNVVILVASLNLTYFGVEFGVATAIGSVSLFADSVDFLEDTSLNFLIAVALGWTAIKRARLGDGACWNFADTGRRHALDSLAKVYGAAAACPDSSVPRRHRRVAHQFVVRVHSRARPIT